MLGERQENSRDHRGSVVAAIAADPIGFLRRVRRVTRRAGSELKAMTVPGQSDWSIGLYAGPSPVQLRPMLRAPVLTHRQVTDRDAAFVADPFMIRVDDRWWLFFEVWNSARRKGEIAVASSPDLRIWTYEHVVLAEAFHLSYPQVFAWNGDFYMVPESFECNSVRLYRASEFPWRWDCVATLLTGGVLLDASLFQNNGLWCMFVETNPKHRYDTLRLFCSPALEGGWREHPPSPIVSNDRHIARPGGRVVTWNGQPVRYGQDCEPDYGIRVRAFAIEELTPDSYRERPLGVVLERGIEGENLGWNASGMHHLDVQPDGKGGWVACVDGRS